MTDSSAVSAFIAKWEYNTQKESSAAKEHFVDLCRLLGVPTPNDPGAGPDRYCFEKSLTKTGGKAGFADVWKHDHFAWEYKGKGKYHNLDAAYTQLLLYKEDLGNPPVLVACDIANYEVHIAFTGYRTRVERFTNADLANASTRELLRQVFTNPELLRPVERQETLTQKAAARLADVARLLEGRGFAPTEIAQFFMKVLFALFAEDIKLLPGELMSQSIKQAIFKPAEFVGRTRALFRAMHNGDYFGMERIPHFNGWLFADDSVLPLNADELQFLADAARLDWSQVEPAIFGTLFERSLDPTKRAQLGAHYTNRDDILLIIEPVLMAPLHRAWADVQTNVAALRQQWEPASGNTRRKLMSVAEGVILDFMERLASIRVLDPACGSGNFLYVALNELKTLEKEVWVYAGGVGLPQPELAVSPLQLAGIEKNQFAAELAQVVVWIGYLQWQRANGFYAVKEPILQTLHTIENRDAILTVDLHGNPAEPTWPAADVIVGNPPFLGDKKMRSEMGDTYVESLRKLYEGRVPGGADLVTYWFEHARALIEQGNRIRVGLLSTNSIRSGANRRVLERIKQTGDIFMAWSDRPWILDGAAVRVSMVGFDAGHEHMRLLNGATVPAINPDLTASVDLSRAPQLAENANLVYLGMMKAGPFDLDAAQASSMLTAPNQSGRSNADVIKRRLGGQDITRRPREGWVIDFGVDTSEQAAAAYELPFDYVRTHVKPLRDQNRRDAMRKRWWIHGEPRRSLRRAIAHLQRCIVTPEVSKHRVFVWMDTAVIPDHTCHVIARDDDYFFGVLHSRAHELWSLQTGNSLEDRPRYNSSKTFETYPFPWPPGHEDQHNPLVMAIAEAARALVALRNQWLAGGEPAINQLPAIAHTLQGTSLVLKDRTLTSLYNKRPDWLAQVHRHLDAAVFAAYGWPAGLSDDDILARLLALNLQRAAVPQAGDPSM